MFYEYALDPELFSDPSVYDFLAASFGRDQGRLIAEYPRKKWLRCAYEQIRAMDMPPVARKQFVEYLIHLRRNALLKPEDRPNPDESLSWLEGVIDQHQKRPFHAILTEGHTEASVPKLQRGPELYRHPLWQATTSRAVERTPEAIVEAARPLIELSRRICLIDRNFHPAEPRFVSVLECFLHHLSTRRHQPTITQLVYVTSYDARRETQKDFIRMCQEILPVKVPHGITLKLLIKPWELLHDRYVLTDVGCLEYGIGLDASNRGDRVNVSRQSEEKRREEEKKLEQGVLESLRITAEGRV